MLSRLTPERERPLVRALQTTRTLFAIGFTTAIVAVLIQADPNHHFAGALFDAIHTWAHAAFPTLIK